ncbi:MAG: MCE family protein [Candidatus Omnitrophota bacterium]|nr:MAG: MCE family protein [Candidatus Omnitrophota bacterium]
MKYTKEFKVGVFFIICVLGLFYLTYSTGKISIRREGYFVDVVFDEIAGLEKNAPVMLNGLEVGKVKDINIHYADDETRVILKVWLAKEAKVRTNPVVSIKTLGLMGEKYIQISSSKGKGFIEPDTTLIGKSYTDMDALMDEAQNISKEVKKLTQTLNSTVEGNQDRVTQMMQNLETTTKNLEEMTEDIKRHPWKLLFRGKEKRTRRRKK